MIELSSQEARAWAAAHASALSALRLNKQFPPYKPLAATAEALALSGSLRLDPKSSLLAAREWVRARADRELATETLQRSADLDAQRLPAVEAARLLQKRAYLQALLDTSPPASRSVEVALRHREGDRASYRVIVDRIDVASGTVARYTLLLQDTPGPRISEGELMLAASAEFSDKLALLSTQDAAFAFAVLRGQGLLVEEIVRGVVGPGAWPGQPAGDELPELEELALSVCLERVSLDLKDGHVDDPIPRSVVVPADGVDFGLSMQRKWAASTRDVGRLKAWLQKRGSRNLVYEYSSGVKP